MRKISFKIASVSLFLITMVFVLSACAAPQITKPTPDPSSTAKIYDITGECSISIKDKKITVSGKTNFDPNVKLNVSVVGQNGMTIDFTDIILTQANEQVSHDFIIDDRYSGVKKVVGYITCSPVGQTDETHQKYGRKFEYIKTDNNNYIWDNNGVVVLFASEMAELPK